MADDTGDEDEILGRTSRWSLNRPTHAFVWWRFLCDFYHEFSPLNFSHSHKMCFYYDPAYMIQGGIPSIYKQDLLTKFVSNRKLSQRRNILFIFSLSLLIIITDILCLIFSLNIGHVFLVPQGREINFCKLHGGALNGFPFCYQRTCFFFLHKRARL